MSDENPLKKRCIIKKLDFENCVVSGGKTKSRRKRKMRARITKNIENIEKTPERNDLSNSPVVLEKFPIGTQIGSFSSQREKSRSSSPVFYCDISGSSVLKSKRKINFSLKDKIVSPQSSTESSPKSPVITCKGGKNTEKKSTEDFGETALKEIKISNTAISQESNIFESEKNFESLYPIEECSQDSKLASSSVDYENIESVSAENYSIDMKSDSNLLIYDKENDSDKLAARLDLLPNQTAESEIPKKNFKKKPLLSRLHVLQKKQASEKLLWQHQRNVSSFLSVEILFVVEIWNINTIYVLKCVSSVPEEGIKYLMVEYQWVPRIKKAKKGSILRLYPPWQKIKLGDSENFALINIICLEVLEEECLDLPPAEEVTFESTKADSQLNIDETVLYNALFSSKSSPFLF